MLDWMSTLIWQWSESSFQYVVTNPWYGWSQNLVLLRIPIKPILPKKHPLKNSAYKATCQRVQKVKLWEVLEAWVDRNKQAFLALYWVCVWYQYDHSYLNLSFLFVFLSWRHPWFEHES